MQRAGSAGLPTRAALHADGLYLVLKDIAATELQDPFMQQTVTRVQAPERIAHIATGALGAIPAATAPAGIIFHVGRCGSTVLSQALKQIGGLVVYAEPLPINELLSPPRGARQEVVLALRGVGTAFAAHASGRYVLKLSSWNTLFADVIAEAFPATPWIFSLRDPVEVGEAILRDPPPWIGGDSEAARHLASIVDPGARSADPAEYIARVFAAFCETMMRLDPARGGLARYDDFGAPLLQRVARHFGAQPDATEMERMRESTTRYAKAPLAQVAPFAPDAAAKRAAAPAGLRAAIDAIARPSYQRLLARFASR